MCKIITSKTRNAVSYKMPFRKEKTFIFIQILKGLNNTLYSSTKTSPYRGVVTLQSFVNS